ncbi:TDP-N-acetylfucosamine:lipid II N-acetylfucosaminyltransferase [Mediterraneibacter glycyrrhizinilyticus]|uniref:TDP-N-acetylfucosamine:lipid II N-acetylfucosaminyltransferase n=1 Tax=Mediterraneibacter glycyrrhizinilyticus TaxID=342942 RepID=UPI001960753F|nr:TDP-N-acetylfucosamine:lipid II N-acetylfucosaminyltransferase [Mediterraneibacter glycyrrhizinilyticus]MBM6752283.1 TDP-N-acetylfucosamine:lipid II N-acetylfucosaminyltransferase [Mediterraneibacter glycyrrhizinilyticus]
MKYLHYMKIPSPVYNNMIIEMIANNKQFDINEHEFIITNRESFEVSKKYKNVIFDPNYNVDKINHNSRNYDYIFIHGFSFKYYEQLLLKKKSLKKMIWCVWGHDLYKISEYNRREDENPILRLIKKILFYTVQIPKIKNIFAIGAGFEYDRLEAKKIYGIKNVVSAPYGLGYDLALIDKVMMNYDSSFQERKTINVMIGHCAYSFLKHMEVMRLLERFKGENIKIMLPLNYGDERYKAELLSALKKTDLEYEVLLEFMKAEDYLEYLKKVDIAIFDFKHQAAMATIMILLYMGKKIYLPKDSIVYKGFLKEGIEVFDYEKIQDESYEIFSDFSFDKSKGIQFTRKRLDINWISGEWKALFDFCERSKL